jgi:hypothetical protein
MFRFENSPNSKYVKIRNLLNIQNIFKFEFYSNMKVIQNILNLESFPIKICTNSNLFNMKLVQIEMVPNLIFFLNF